MLGLQLPSPLQEIHIENNQSIRFYIKRDDLIHEHISGNKWRKLKFQIQEATENGKKGIITFGGAFSNHIVATAAACQLSGLQSIGIIRGEATALKNPTLQMANQYGMNFHFVNRTDYRLKTESPLIQNTISRYGECHVVPEGGSHKNALIGVAEVIDELSKQSTKSFDYALCAIGTGTTYAGLANSFKGELIGINVLKNKAIQSEICALLELSNLESRYKIFHDYHFGGYAKYTPELIEFMHEFYRNYDLKTDVIYTSKLLFAVLDLLNNNYFKYGSRVMIYHSGGLQGNAGMNFRFPGLIRF